MSKKQRSRKMCPKSTPTSILNPSPSWQSPDSSPSTPSSATKAQKKKNKSPDPFLILRGLRAGETICKKPPVFGGPFRLGRGVVSRVIPKYAVLHEGRLYIYRSKSNAKKNRLWRVVDLEKVTVSYRQRDSKLLFGTPEEFKMTVSKDHFQRWVDTFRKHRLYAQAKSTGALRIGNKHTPSTPPSSAKTQTPSKSPTQPPAPAETLIKVKQIIETKRSSRPLLPRTKLPVVSIPVAVHQSSKKQIARKQSPVATVVPIQRMQKSPPVAKNPPPVSKNPSPVSKNPSPISNEPKSTAMLVPAALGEQEKVALLVKAMVDESKAVRPSSAAASSPAAQEPQQVTEAPKKDAAKSPPQEADERSPDDSDASEPGESCPGKSGTFIPMRMKLPAPMVPPPSLFKLIMSALGKDVMRISLPASVMEPLSALQMLCEELEYSELLDKALLKTDAQWRMMYVAAFAMSRYGATAHRANRKPFNPLLGETFDYTHPKLGWRFITEQVSHHPPVSAVYAEGRGWKMWQDCELVAALSASTVKATPKGLVFARLEKWKETYHWNKVVSQVSGILSGTYTIEHMGDMVITCPQTKLKCKMTFKKMTPERRGEIEGQVMDSDGRVLRRLSGNWADSFYAGTDEEDDDDDEDLRLLWRLAPMPPHYQRYYGFTAFAMGLNELRPDVHGELPPTDTRFRPDQRALELGKVDEADQLKHELEERQRQRRKANEAKNIGHSALWFQPTGHTNPATGARWQFKGTYWKEKKSKFMNTDFLELW